MGTAFDIDEFSMNDCVGIIPRAIVDIFEQIDSMTESDYAVEAQFIEVIYLMIFNYFCLAL